MVYEPAEDSFLLEKWVKQYATGNVLDIGTGSGIQSKAAAEKACKVIAVDINPKAKDFLASKIEFRQGNLFSPIKENEKFNLITFNPPYLPEDKFDKSEITTGGKQGWEIIKEFLKQAKTHLAKDGKILIVFSSLTNESKVLEIAEKLGYQSKLLEKQHVAFEDLFIYEFDLS